MATRRDQLQSYQFLTQRVISAFVMRETDPAQSPLRRGIGAVFAGSMIAVLVAAVFGIYGLLTKIGSGDWKVDGTVVVEKETGAAYVYKDGVLFPTVNFTSAILAAAQPAPHVVKTSTNSLRGATRGPRIGIVGAPDSLPDASHTVGTPWTLCSLFPSGSNSKRPTLLIVGGGPSGAQTLSSGLQGQGLLVSGPGANGASVLVWNGRRYLIPNAADRQALFGPAQPVAVGAAWLNGLYAGDEIASPTVPTPGADSPISGHKAGDVVFTVNGQEQKYYLVFPDGVAGLTSLQRDMLAGRPGYNPQEIQRGEANAHPSAQVLQESNRDVAPPDTTPKLLQPTASTDPLCIQSGNAHAFSTVSVGGTVADSQLGTPTTSQSQQGASLADRVSVPTGKVALIQSIDRPTATNGGTVYLVSDIGTRYVVPSPDVLKILGFQPEQVIAMPDNLVSRIPLGPTLDIGPARQAVDVSTVEGN